MKISLEDAKNLASIIARRRPDWREPTAILNAILDLGSQNDGDALIAHLPRLAADPQIRTPQGLRYVTIPGGQGSQGGNGEPDFGPRCSICNRTMSTHEGAESKVDYSMRHGFITRDEHDRKVTHERHVA